MSETSNWLVHDHGKYDALLAECEELAEEGLWEDALRVYRQFLEELKLHMRMEDEILYPLYEEQYGDPRGELTYLQGEHDNIAWLLHELAYVLKRNNTEHFLDSVRPLHKALNRHNANEEELFLNLEDDSILLRRDEIMQRLNSMQDEAGKRVWHI